MMDIEVIDTLAKSEVRIHFATSGIYGLAVKRCLPEPALCHDGKQLFARIVASGDYLTAQRDAHCRVVSRDSALPRYMCIISFQITSDVQDLQIQRAWFSDVSFSRISETTTML